MSKRKKKNGTEKCNVIGCTTPYFGLRYKESYGGYLCNKHRIQFERHNYIVDRTIYDKNRIIINKELNCAEMELYDKNGNVIATTLFDIEDIPLVSKYKWNLNKSNNKKYTDYVECGGSTSKERYSLHRLLLGNYDCINTDTDHKNGNGLDNRKSNLRECTKSQNMINKSAQVNSLLGYKNIHYRKSGNKYVVQIKNKNNKIRKQFATLQQAIDFRNSIYEKQINNINLFRDNIDNLSRVHFDCYNNIVFIHEKGRRYDNYAMLFDYILQNKYYVVIDDFCNIECKDKLFELFDAAKIIYKTICLINSKFLSDPLHENNLDEVLKLVQEIRISFPEKTIWLYTGYTFEECQPFSENGLLSGSKFAPNLQKILKKRWEIISNVDVLVDGEYIDGQRDVTKKWAGSKNQQVINVKESIKNNKIILYCD